jgi:hypothetical protein
MMKYPLLADGWRARTSRTSHASRLAFQQLHPLVLVGLGMLLTLLLLCVTQWSWAWNQQQLAALRYGSPPTTQTEHAVGHGGLSHFTAWNLHGQVYVLEIPGSQPDRSHLLEGPHLIGADLASVQLVFVGNPTHPDLLVQVQDIVTRFHNTGTSYA